MAFFVCKCLNVNIESDKFEDNVDIEKLELSSTEQRDIFFSEQLFLCPIGSLKTNVTQPALLSQRNVGQWTIHFCLACKQSTHAILNDQTNGQSIALICKSTLTTLEKVNSLKQSNNFSPAFNLLVPEVTSDIDMKENIDTNNQIFNDNKLWPTQQMIGSLNKQLSQTLQSKLEAVEDSVKQFTDQKYAEYEAYRERAQRDHKILASIVTKARGNVDSDGWRLDTSIDNGPPSPQLLPLQRRRLSSFKDAKKVSQNIPKVRHFPQEDDSLDAEDLFDLEGMESNRHNMISDNDDYDSDQGSNDEGIHISRRRTSGGHGEIAHSLPIDMPKFPNDRVTRREFDDDEEPTDIAASIKALARSVHGDVFELPRPRVSSQI